MASPDAAAPPPTEPDRWRDLDMLLSRPGNLVDAHPTTSTSTKLPITSRSCTHETTTATKPSQGKAQQIEKRNGENAEQGEEEWGGRARKRKSDAALAAHMQRLDREGDGARGRKSEGAAAAGRVTAREGGRGRARQRPW